MILVDVCLSINHNHIETFSYFLQRCLVHLLWGEYSYNLFLCTDNILWKVLKWTPFILLTTIIALKNTKGLLWQSSKVYSFDEKRKIIRLSEGIFRDNSWSRNIFFHFDYNHYHCTTNQQIRNCYEGAKNFLN